ncbi:MAG: hypothetical protein FWG05_00610 [Kiritimatiellaeota bacterium]|nr:hypothetical protein [Kiritimatiellota bacterium]
MRRSHFILCAASAFAAASGCVSTESVTVAEPPPPPYNVRIDQPDWGDGVSAEFAEKVCVSVADIFWRHGNVAVGDPVLVYQTDPAVEPWPIAYYRPAPGGERIIKLASYGPYRSQIAYQFAHEYCHVLTKHWKATGHHNNMWLAECFCELASIWTITKMGEDWANGHAPDGWAFFARHMTDYVNNHTKNTRRFESPAEFAEWLTPRLPDCYKNSKPAEVFKTAPVQLLPYFLEDPTLWEPVAHLNNSVDREADFPTYMRQWRDSVPEELKAKVEKIAEAMGLAL